MVSYFPNPFRSARNVSVAFPKAPASFLVKATSAHAGNGTLESTTPIAKQNDAQDATIQSFIEEHCPSLKKNYYSSWWLPNGHMQTMYCVTGDFSQIDHISYKRYCFSIKMAILESN
jgi:hypothetical protein